MSRIGDLWRRRRGVVAIAAVGVAGTAGSAGALQPEDTSPPSTDETEPLGDRCIVRLHGKSGTGADSYDENGVLNVLPSGNAEGWGGRQWLYFPEDRFEEARSIVADAIDASGCDNVIVNGFSNGAAFAAKLYCRGETFGGRVFRFVLDDPVPDQAVLECTPDPDVDVVLYWTGALAGTATPGWDCSRSDWTCEGGTTIGIDAYAERLGVEVTPSIHTSHDWYWEAPALGDWTRRSSSEPSPETTSG